MKKLTKKQQECFDLVKEYLTSDYSNESGIEIGDNNFIWGSLILNLWKNGSGVWVKYFDGNKNRSELISPKDVPVIHRKAIVKDASFAYFLAQEHTTPENVAAYQKAANIERVNNGDEPINY